MKHIDAPQTRCRAGFARKDITPPVGIYHRLWGAATHERSTGVHRPLTATGLWLERYEDGDPQLILALDQCLLDAADTATIKARVAETTQLSPERVQVTVSHTHASGWMSMSRSPYPGGELIGQYLKWLAHRCADLARQAADAARPAAIVFGKSHCALAGHRDYFDAERKQFVCGYNPAGPADDTVLVGRVTAEDGTTLGTIVNYACHPTTLAWENTLLSPDFVGAMREVIELHTASPCVFLQGASGDLGPRDGFVGDPAMADRNGRQLGFAALAGTGSPAAARHALRVRRPSRIRRNPWNLEAQARRDRCALDMANDHDRSALSGRLAHDRGDGARTRAIAGKRGGSPRCLNDLDLARDCHAHVERMNRQLIRLACPAGRQDIPLPSGPRPYRNGAMGACSGRAVSSVPNDTAGAIPGSSAIVIATLANDWQPGYLPTAASYGKGIYQETIAVVGAGEFGVAD